MLPLVFIVPAVVMGVTGVGIGTKGGVDQAKAIKLNKNSDARIENAVSRLDDLRIKCGESLTDLGEEKIYILNNGLRKFVEEFSKMKNVDFKDSVGLSELENLHLDEKDFEELKQLTNIAIGMAGGTVAGAAGGALVALGAYNAAMLLGTASTGTAISALSGAAATNATLAFFGGGSLAAGGLGMAGGTAVLGGIVAGPALLTMGIIVGAQGKKNLDKAKINAANVNETCAQYELGGAQCIAIRRRSYMFYNLLAQLDALLLPLVFRMQDIIAENGVDFSKYPEEDKKIVRLAATISVTAKTVLDTPILSEEGELTQESSSVVKEIDKKIIAIEGNK